MMNNKELIEFIEKEKPSTIILEKDDGDVIFIHPDQFIEILEGKKTEGGITLGSPDGIIKSMESRGDKYLRINNGSNNWEGLHYLDEDYQAKRREILHSWGIIEN